MYVCLCKGVTDTAIRHAAQAGVSDFRSLRQQTGVAGQCGKCACNAREVLRCALASLQRDTVVQQAITQPVAQYYPAVANG